MTSRILGVVAVVAVCWMPRTAALFEQCNHLVELQAGQRILVNSPYYPDRYPAGSSCRYTLKAPADHRIRLKCDLQLSMPFGGTRCRNEVFYFNREGSELLSGSEYFCGTGTMERSSFLNRAVLSYISTPVYNRKAGPTQLAASVAAPFALPATAVAFGAFRPGFLQYTAAPGFTVGGAVGAVGVSNALSYVVTLLTGQLRPRRPAETLASSTALHNGTEDADELSLQLPPTLSAAWSSALTPSVYTLVQQPRIVFAPTGSAVLPGTATSTAPSTGGVFSCLAEVQQPDCECGWRMSAKIAGDSTEAAPNEFPSMAGVMTVRSNKIFCGAAIIHHHYLLSAAHCFLTPETNHSSLIRIVVGEHDLSTVLESLYTRFYEVAAILPHEKFHSTASAVRNDIAVLRTRWPIEWNRSVGPACLPFRSLFRTATAATTSGVGAVRRLPAVGQRVETAGWGTTTFGGTQSVRLRKTTLDVIAAEQCRRAVGGSLPAGTFCTYTPGRDTCQFDSGGALYVRQEQLFAVGIVSYGYACATHKPSVNTRIASHLQWIRSKTPDVHYCVK